MLEYKTTDGWYIARTFYHARGGGATEASMNVFTGASGKPGTQGQVPHGWTRTWMKTAGRTTWVRTSSGRPRAFTLDQLSAILAKDSRTDVGKLTSWPIESESAFRSKRAAALLADVRGPDPRPGEPGRLRSAHLGRAPGNEERRGGQEAGRGLAVQVGVQRA